MSLPPTSADASRSRRGPATGRTLAGKYLLGDLLGEGGRGEVYAAIQIDLDRPVAVKVLSAGAARGDERARFLRETRIAAEIRHPGVVQIFDAGVDDDGAPYCAMEMLEGETLAERLARFGPLPVGEAVATAASVCGALQAVHDKGFLHRDVKPGNIMLARRVDGGTDPKLIDFGIARRIAVSEATRQRLTTRRGLGRPVAQTALEVIVGTPRYLSPEQIVGGDLDARSDVYALAVTLYEALAGEPPFAADEVGELLGRILGEAPPSLATRALDREARGVPATLDAAIRRALAKNPGERPASAADFAASLWTALASARLAEAPPEIPLESPRARLGLAVVVSVAVSAAALLAVGITRHTTSAAATAATPAAPRGPVTPATTAAMGDAPPSLASLGTSEPGTGTAARPAPATGPRDRATRRATAPRKIDDLKTPY